MFSEFQAPGYLHVLINHVPIIGAAMGLLGLVVGILMRSRAALVPALAIVIVAGISAWPVTETGETAYRPVMRLADEPGRNWLNEHSDRAERVTWIFYAMAGVAAVALAAPFKWPRSAVPLGAAAAFAALAGIGAGVYIAQAGGLIRHSEFRIPDVVPAAVEAPGSDE